MEANNHAFQATPHKCDAPVGNGHYNNCDRGGCAQNTRDIGKAYGVGKEFKINTRHPFRVSTTFEAQGETLTGYKTVLSQEGRTVVLEHANCDKNYLAQLSKAVQEGMSLIFSYWGASAQTMAWMDSPPCGPEVCQASSGHGIISDLSVSTASRPARSPTASSLPSLSPSPAQHHGHGGSGDGGGALTHMPKTVTTTTRPNKALTVLHSRLGPIKWSNHPDTCLTVEASALMTAACDRQDTKQIFQSLGDGKIRWFANPRYCIAVAEDLNQNGASVILSECLRGNSTLKFSFPWDDMKIHWAKHPAMCLDVTNHRSAPGTPIQMWTCLSDDDDQVFVWPQLRDKPSTATEKSDIGAKTTTLVPALYDCLGMDSTWRPWTSMKRSWCCKFKSIGCEHTTTKQMPFDCSFGYPDWVSAWSEQKRGWCCKHQDLQHLACSQGETTTSTLKPAKQFDCFSFLQDGWSLEHRSWCCSNENVACDVAPPSQHSSQIVMPIQHGQQPLPYNCTWRYNDWAQTWSAAQAEWCCKHVGRGCRHGDSELKFRAHSANVPPVGMHVAHARFQKLTVVPAKGEELPVSSNMQHGRPVAVLACSACVLAAIVAAVSLLRQRRRRLPEQVGTALIQQPPEWDE